MKKSTVILFTAFLTFCTLAKSQTPQESNSIPSIEKATYQKEDLNKALWKNLTYPQEAFLNKVQGDVVFSLVVNTDGKLDDINIVSTPAHILTLSSVASLDGVSEGWSPAKANGVPVNKTYLLVYRYRVYQNSSPPEYDKKATKLLKKQKYEKALKLYNEAIDENPYDYSLFEARANIEEIMGDTISAKEDREQVTNLKSAVISTVDVTVISRKVTKYLGTQVMRSDQMPVNY